jgi:hypothetical protein
LSAVPSVGFWFPDPVYVYDPVPPGPPGVPGGPREPPETLPFPRVPGSRN